MKYKKSPISFLKVEYSFYGGFTFSLFHQVYYSVVEVSNYDYIYDDLMITSSIFFSPLITYTIIVYIGYHEHKI